MSEERVAVVSGGNRGIGHEVAGQLATRGYTVVLGARDRAKGEAAARELGDAGEVVAKQLDVTDEDSIERLARDLETEFRRVDVLVNNAGVIGGRGSAAEPDLDDVKRVLETNLFGAWRLTTALLPLLRRAGSARIVNVSSGMGQLSDMNGGSPGYRLSKTGLNALTRMLASELASTKILVNSVCPGWVRTDMGGSGARRSVEVGADTIVWLATLPEDGPSGGFFRDREPIAW